MGSVIDLLLGVWREACRHIELSESTAAIFAMLSGRMPLGLLVFREFDVKRGCLETVAAAPAAQRASAGADRTALAPTDMERVLAWSRRGEVGRLVDGATTSEWIKALPGPATTDVLVGGLSNVSGPLGVVVVTGQPTSRFGSDDVSLLQTLLEPFTVALENHRRLRELTALREAAEAEKQSLLTRLGRTHVSEVIVGADAGLRSVLDRVELVARSDVPVLILGETGAGKEVVARAIHSRSLRASGPFVRVNCGAIPHDLIDSQLFGHERGSFTGAVDTRKGWFERADGGTLFLDEIGDLPQAVQVRLLRVLQDGYLERVGGHAPIKVDTRIVTATHRDLTAMVREDRFREDLWYRIAVFPVLLPPLRERPEDIPALARHFSERAAIRFGLPVRMPTEQDLALLGGYSWPGNVRELSAVIDRAAILGSGERLEVAKALGIAPAPNAAPPVDEAPPAPAASDRRGVSPLDAAMRRHIESALSAAHGRIEGPHGAARLLNVNPHTLRARMRRLGIEWGRFRTRP